MADFRRNGSFKHELVVRKVFLTARMEMQILNRLDSPFCFSHLDNSGGQAEKGIIYHSYKMQRLSERKPIGENLLTTGLIENELKCMNNTRDFRGKEISCDSQKPPGINTRQ